MAIEPHGAELRGLELVLESPTAEGRFGYMFKNQSPHAASEDLLSALGQTMEDDPSSAATSPTRRRASQF